LQGLQYEIAFGLVAREREEGGESAAQFVHVLDRVQKPVARHDLAEELETLRVELPKILKIRDVAEKRQLLALQPQELVLLILAEGLLDPQVLEVVCGEQKAVVPARLQVSEHIVHSLI